MNPIVRTARMLLACTLFVLQPLAHAAAPDATPAAKAAPFVDVLDLPAAASALAARAQVNALAMAGMRVVGAGQRGHIVYSDDAGIHWQQARVPVSSDLVALHFPTPQSGWAVGHDGVVLHTIDSGATWQRQLDGRAIAALLLRTYDHDGVDAAVRAAAKRLAAQGADQALLDVWFDNERSGFVVGAFNLIFHTADGGASWQPWLDRSANRSGFHLNAIRTIAGDTYIAGEQGLLLKLAADGSRFDALAAPYQGSFFGLAGGPGALLVYGLRGNAYLSADRGLAWRRVDTGVQVGLVAAAVLPDDRLVLVSQAGHVLVSADHGASFSALAKAAGGPTAAVAPGEAGTIVLGGLRGMRRQLLNAP